MTAYLSHIEAGWRRLRRWRRQDCVDLARDLDQTRKFEIEIGSQKQKNKNKRMPSQKIAQERRCSADCSTAYRAYAEADTNVVRSQIDTSVSISFATADFVRATHFNTL